MAVVRGDRIGESETLNRVSRDAQVFYSAFVAAVPDDFGRFRLAWAHIWGDMFPRREPTPSDLKWVQRMVTDLVAVDAFLVYVVDGQQFAEVAKWRPSGNMVHRCPEPPMTAQFMPHQHTGRCLSTAISRAREWGSKSDVAILINRLQEIKSLRQRKPDGSPTEGGTEGGTEQGTPVNPSIRQSVQELTATDKQAGEPTRNPLVDRDALVREGHALITEIATAENIDPTEVLLRGSKWNGRGKVRLDVMRDDRLAHTLGDLRAWSRRLRGEPEPVARAPEPERVAPKDREKVVYETWLQGKEAERGAQTLRGRDVGALEGEGGTGADGRPTRGLLASGRAADTGTVGPRGKGGA